jgi:hypothetical protein
VGDPQSPRLCNEAPLKPGLGRATGYLSDWQQTAFAYLDATNLEEPRVKSADSSPSQRSAAKTGPEEYRPAWAARSMISTVRTVLRRSLTSRHLKPGTHDTEMHGRSIVLLAVGLAFADSASGYGDANWAGQRFASNRMGQSI